MIEILVDGHFLSAAQNLIDVDFAWLFFRFLPIVVRIKHIYDFNIKHKFL